MIDDFAAALKKLPSCAMGNFDPLTHTTIADLRYCVQHELDMFYEGEDSEIQNTREADKCRAYLYQLQ